MTAGGVGVGSEFLEPFVLEKDTVMVIERLLANNLTVFQQLKGVHTWRAAPLASPRRARGKARLAPARIEECQGRVPDYTTG